VSGLGWSAATQILGKGLQFVTTIALARLLSPGEFGLIGMVVVITGFAASIADAGLGASIIQRQSLSDDHLSSVFWLNLALGSALTLLFIASASLIAGFYNEPELRPLVVAMAFIFLLGSLTIVQYALLQKSLEFRSRFWIETVVIVVSAVVALAMALGGAGVWSLVGQALSGTFARVVMVWRLSDWRPRWSFDLAAIKTLLGFGGHLVVFNVIVYCAQNFDKLVIGHQIGSTALGIYSLADRWMRLPLDNVTSITSTVMFPALSSLQDNVESVQRAYLRGNRMIALVTFPMMLGMSVLAEPLVLVFFGERWRGAITIARLLCFAGLAQSVYNTASWIFLSRGRPDILFRLGVLSMLTRIGGVILGTPWGLLGIAWAYVLGGYLFLLYPTWSSAARIIGLTFADLLRCVAPPFFCAVPMAAVIWLLNEALTLEHPYWVRLLLVPIGIVIYGVLIRTFRLKAWNDLRDLILDAGGQKSRLIRWLLGSDAPIKNS